jgi:hypothetical protein
MDGPFLKPGGAVPPALRRTAPLGSPMVARSAVPADDVLESEESSTPMVVPVTRAATPTTPIVLNLFSLGVIGEIPGGPVNLGGMPLPLRGGPIFAIKLPPLAKYYYDKLIPTLQANMQKLVNLWDSNGKKVPKPKLRAWAQGKRPELKKLLQEHVDEENKKGKSGNMAPFSAKRDWLDTDDAEDTFDVAYRHLRSVVADHDDLMDAAGYFCALLDKFQACDFDVPTLKLAFDNFQVPGK